MSKRLATAEDHISDPARLSALARYDIMGTDQERGFDALARLAAEICNAPIGMITFVDDAQQFFKSAVGYAGDRISSLEVGFCPTVVRGRSVVIIPDTAVDPSTVDNIATKGGVRFYAGVPLTSSDDFVLGTLCVLDTAARPTAISENQRQSLEALAGQVVMQLELRRSEAISRRERARAEKHAHRLSAVAQAADLLLSERDPTTMARRLFEHVAESFGVDIGFHYRCGDGSLGLVAAAGLSAQQEHSALKLEFGHLVCGIVAQRREPMHVTAIQSSKEDLYAPLKGLGLESYYSTPLLAGGDLLGTISFGRRSRDFSKGEVQALQTIASQFAASLERQHAEAELRALNGTLENEVEERSSALRLYRDIVKSDRSPIIAFDRDMRITTFNEAHANAYLLIHGVKQRVGDAVIQGSTPEQAEIEQGYMARALAGESFIVHEARNSGLDMPHSQIAYSPLLDEQGTIVGGFLHALDVTSEVRARLELEETQEALRQSQKMEAIGQLTGGVAHDFNNLLTVIRGSVDLLRRENLSSDRRDRYLDAIGDTADRAAKLTGQLLAFARRQTLEPETFEIGRRLDAIGEMLDSITGARVLIRYDLPAGPCSVHADASQFETAIVNLAVNARDAMAGDGTLTFRLRCGVKMPSIRGHGPGAGDFVAISLTDTGSGILATDIERIFEPFFTTKEVGKGTGLGLSQVFGFAKQSGGDVDVESVVGQGSTFTLYLPTADGLRKDVRRQEEQLGPVDGDGRRVLVVEDNISVGEFATQLLDDIGYRTRWVTSAEEALTCLEDIDEEGYDVVFSDVVMPGMGGVELARRLARDMPALPVLLASGYSHVLVKEGLEGLELLRKPYSATQLSVALQRLVSPEGERRG